MKFETVYSYNYNTGEWDEISTGFQYDLKGNRLPNLTAREMVDKIRRSGGHALVGDTRIGKPIGPPIVIHKDCNCRTCKC